MQTYRDVVANRQGVPVAGASVLVKLLADGFTDLNSGTLAVLYDALGNSMANPFTATDGSFAFSAANGKYAITVSVNEQVSDPVGPVELYDPADAPVATLASLAASSGSSLIGFIDTGVGAVKQSVQAILRAFAVTPQKFGALGDGVTDDTAAFVAMWATGRPWDIPETTNGYLVTPPSGGFQITSSGKGHGAKLIVPTGFAGVAGNVVNPTYGKRLLIEKLKFYSTDVRPNPYTAAKTVGILVGPNATYSGNTPCPGVTLLECEASRFSIPLQISTFNVEVIGGAYIQGDHNALVYSYDTTYNQVNDVSFINVQLDSPAAQPGKIAYSLRVGTTGDGTYVGNSNMGVNLRIEGCNFDGGAVYIDNIYGVSYQSNYHEQSVIYSYTGGAVVLGSAGATYLRNANIERCWFTNFDYGIDVVNQVSGLTVHPNSYATIKYAAVRLDAAETQTFNYRSGQALGSTNWANGRSEVLTNFSGGIAVTQLAFANMQIEGDYLTNGAQLAPNQIATTNWYPNGMTNDGWKNVASAYGRFRSGAAAQTGIAGTQAGSTLTFTTLSDALKFNGGDRITSSAGSASFIKSVDYSAGTAVLDSSYSGAITISHDAAYFVGYALSGSGSPNGVVTANPGSLYTSTAGGAGTTEYVKESGTGNTGWVGK